MKPIERPAGFDCIAFKRETQLRMYEETKEMTRQQEIDYLEKKASDGPLAELWRELKRRAA